MGNPLCWSSALCRRRRRRRRRCRRASHWQRSRAALVDARIAAGREVHRGRKRP